MTIKKKLIEPVYSLVSAAHTNAGAWEWVISSAGSDSSATCTRRFNTEHEAMLHIEKQVHDMNSRAGCHGGGAFTWEGAMRKSRNRAHQAHNRAKTTGRFLTREDLERAVIGFRRSGKAIKAIAIDVLVSSYTVSKILGECQ